MTTDEPTKCRNRCGFYIFEEDLCSICYKKKHDCFSEGEKKALEKKKRFEEEALEKQTRFEEYEQEIKEAMQSNIRNRVPETVEDEEWTKLSQFCRYIARNVAKQPAGQLLGCDKPFEYSKYIVNRPIDLDIKGRENEEIGPAWAATECDCRNYVRL